MQAKKLGACSCKLWFRLATAQYHLQQYAACVHSCEQGLLLDAGARQLQSLYMQASACLRSDFFSQRHIDLRQAVRTSAHAAACQVCCLSQTRLHPTLLLVHAAYSELSARSYILPPHMAAVHLHCMVVASAKLCRLTLGLKTRGFAYVISKVCMQADVQQQQSEVEQYRRKQQQVSNAAHKHDNRPYTHLPDHPNSMRSQQPLQLSPDYKLACRLLGIQPSNLADPASVRQGQAACLDNLCHTRAPCLFSHLVRTVSEVKVYSWTQSCVRGLCHAIPS